MHKALAHWPFYTWPATSSLTLKRLWVQVSYKLEPHLAHKYIDMTLHCTLAPYINMWVAGKIAKMQKSCESARPCSLSISIMAHM